MAQLTRSVRHGALHALVLVALAACGSTDPPTRVIGGAGDELRVARGLSIVIQPSGPHYLLPREGFGKTVAISGARVAVADYLDWEYAGFSLPHVDTFEIVEGNAVSTGQLPPEGWGELCFGTTIAIAGDLIVVGEPCANGGAGEVHTWARVKAGWVEDPPLAPATAAAPAQFGGAIAMAANRMVVGAAGESAVGLDGAALPHAGAAYVYSRAGGRWRLDARLAPADVTAYDRFGFAVSMTAARIAATEPGRWNGYAYGRVHLFDLLPDGTWTEGTVLRPTDDPPGEQSGRTVALCSGTLFVGNGTWDWPAVHAFREGLDGWSELDLEDPSPPPLGHVDALACSGDLLAVGMPFASPAAQDWIGAVRLYKLLGGAWLNVGEIAGSAPKDRAGHSVAVDRSIVVVGVPSAMVGERALGIVRVARY